MVEACGLAAVEASSTGPVALRPGIASTTGWRDELLQIKTPLAAAALLAGLAVGVARAQAPLDPTTVARSSRPNDALICAADACSAQADAAPPIFDAPPETLLAAVEAVLRGWPRLTISGTDPQRLLVTAEVRSALFGFVDDVAVRVLPQPSGDGTLAIYSRSRLGYWDFGVNDRRARALLEAVAARLGDKS